MSDDLQPLTRRQAAFVELWARRHGSTPVRMADLLELHSGSASALYDLLRGPKQTPGRGGLLGRGWVVHEAQRWRLSAEAVRRLCVVERLGPVAAAAADALLAECDDPARKAIPFPSLLPADVRRLLDVRRAELATTTEDHRHGPGPDRS